MIALLRGGNVEYVVDVRTYPVSRYRPEFTKGPLADRLAAEDLRYVFMGDVLGGRPDDPSCYDDDGHVDYARCRERPWFDEGISRIETASRSGLRLALLCSEARPDECHRTKLVGEELSARGVEVVHIDERGSLIRQDEVMDRLSDGQLSLLGAQASAQRSRKAYRVA